MKLEVFTKEDWFGFPGAERFLDGSDPMIAYPECDSAYVICHGGEGPNKGSFVVEAGSACCPEGVNGYQSTFPDYETALMFAIDLATLLDDKMVDNNSLEKAFHQTGRQYNRDIIYL